MNGVKPDQWLLSGRLTFMPCITRQFKVALPWELLYADDLAVIAETEEELIKRLNEWKENVESKGICQYE